ncbi:MAG: PAS domain S-box protein, partial [Thermoplasmata archaeon]|nr:PAS domain S-box protein [Thermoplasmata archaeon]
MSSIKTKLAYLILGQKGGANRMNILKSLSERPFNTNQLAETLELNYHTVQYHIKVLLENDVIIRSSSGGYGDVFFLAPELEENMKLLEDYEKKLNSSSALTTFASSDVFFKQVMEQIHDIAIILNTKGQVFFWNKSAEELTGYGKSEVLGEEIQIFSGIDRYSDLMKKLGDNDRLTGYRAEAINIEGDKKNIEISLSTIKDDDDKKIGYTLIARDVTEQIKEESILKENEQTLSMIFDNSPVGMILVNNDITIHKMNRASSSLISTEADGKLPGEAFGCVNHIDSPGGCGTTDLCQVCQVRGILSDTARSGKPYHMIETSLDIKEGDDISTLNFKLSTVPLYDQGERKVLLIIHSVD